MAQDRTITSVIESRDYEKFKILPSNRPVRPGHVAELIDKMRRKYQLAPIMVNRRMEILDGQHRYMAAKELGLPIRYYVSTTAQVNEMAELNNGSKGWNNKDRAHHYMTEGNENYRKYFEFITRYPKLSFSMAIILLSGNTSRNTSEERNFQDGTFRVKKYEDALKKAEFFQSMSTYYTGWNRRSFILAVLGMMDHKDFDATRFLRKMRQKGSTIPNYSNSEDYLKKLEELYNFGEHKRVRFY